MKFDEETIKILKNFSTINMSIAFREGNTLRTRDVVGSVFAKAIVDDPIPFNACVFDLNRFLSTLSLFKDPTVEVGTENKFLISGDNKTVDYTFCNESVIVTPANHDPIVEGWSDDILFSNENFTDLRKALAVLKLEDIRIVGDESGVNVFAYNKKGATKDNFKIWLSEEPVEDGFDVSVKSENLKMIPTDYKMAIKPGKAIRLVSNNDRLTYWCAVKV